MLNITATELPRFITCNGVHLMGEGLSPINGEDMTQRNEGKTADWIIGEVFSKRITAVELIERKSPFGVYVTANMIDDLSSYLEDVVNNGGAVEAVTTMEEPGVWRVGGRTDSWWISGTTLHVNDFKYGWSIVDAEENWTLIWHAISLIVQNNLVHVDEVILTIYQPRPYHQDGPVRSWSVPVDVLMSHYRNRLVQALSYPKNELNAGKQCFKCPVSHKCPAFRKSTMVAMEVSEMLFIDSIDNEKLSSMMELYKNAEKVIETGRKAYEELAAHRIKEGQVVPNYALDRQVGNREIMSQYTPEMIELFTGRNDLTTKKSITPKQMEVKGVDPEFVAMISERRDKGVKLVRIDANKRAEKMFGKNKT